jgi:hypothetical protein
MAIVGPVPDSVISEIPNNLQDALSILMFVGASFALTGSLMGSWFFFPRANKITMYRLGIIGTPAIAASLAFYGWAIVNGTPSFTSAMAGMMSPSLCVSAIVNSIFLGLEIRRIKRNLPRARGEVQDQIKANEENDA